MTNISELFQSVPVSLILTLGLFGSIISFYFGFSSNEALNARARAFARQRNTLKNARLKPRRSEHRPRSFEKLNRVLDVLRLSGSEEARKASSLLTQAGFRSRDVVAMFLAARLISPIMMGLLIYFFSPLLLHGLNAIRQGVAGVLGMLLGALAPNLYIKNAVQNRLQKLHRGLPDALDLFVICTEAGQSLDAAIVRVAREIGAAAPELADELGMTAIELGFLPNRADALSNFALRAPSPLVRNFVQTLAQTERYGTPLAQSLRVLASEFRDTRMMKAEEKAARLPAILTVPMIVFILPPLFVILIGPAAIQILATVKH